MDQIWLWLTFNALVVALLSLDLLVFHKEAHQVTTREAALTSIVWVATACAFGAGIAVFRGLETSLEYFAGYVIEKTLSVDNLFVFVLIFSFFRVPPRYQHRVLFWGVLGALVMRGLMIAAGSYLIHHFHFVVYAFGAFLVYSGIRMGREHGMDFKPDDTLAFRLIKRLIPVTTDYHGQHFFVRDTAHAPRRLTATPLFVVLVLVEATDLLFAVDSIPAVFAVTDDPFIVYSSNVFAILGLRALYFLLADVMDRFHYLKTGLAVVLVFVGAKMMAADLYKIPITASLAIIVVVLGCSIAASLLRPRPDAERDRHS